METYYWGIDNEQSEKNNKKRTYSKMSNKTTTPKKPKFVFGGNKRIYTIGTEIHFTDGINNDTIEIVIRKITKIINENHKKYEDSGETLTITYIVDSPGGSVTAILKFVDYIKLARKKYPYLKFTSIITGCVASAGTIMCIVADKRLMTHHAHSMIHELSSGNSGKYTHLISYSNHLTNLHEALLNIYMDGTNNKQTKEDLEKLLATESWFTAKEYLDGGFVDEIAGS
jgi:ATP-dependent protease ClpP protease subunit